MREFQELRRLSRAGEAWRGRAERLRLAILHQLDWEEAEMFPILAGFLHTDRPTREMLYEHQGIRKFLPQLEDSLADTADNRAWERFSLDLIHLLEHHIEHEEDGLYLVFERLF
ncbi:MAG: hemerythrin domain-containing protein [Candidatus Eremiobacteraeota bacterium]|nr:hemerythrin domain-containing protein [Candidatus Eremiobacteraeota bacterium]MCW5868977.1 hemerythrin domain-containing protein [Candidatus Eremiobacteraeota bacterium]